jgi:hypothetical protein
MAPSTSEYDLDGGATACCMRSPTLMEAAVRLRASRLESARVCVRVLLQEGAEGGCTGDLETGHRDLAGGRTAEECGDRGGRRDAGAGCAQNPSTPEAPHASRQAAQAAPTFECISYLSLSLIRSCNELRPKKTATCSVVRFRARRVCGRLKPGS